PKFSPWVVINDVGSFFQSRFVEAIEKWDVGTADQRALIAKGKEARGTFSYDEIADITEYNKMEIVLLQELMEKFRGSCETVGYVPARWQGPGLLAESMFKRHGVARSRDINLFSDPTMAGL